MYVHRSNNKLLLDNYYQPKSSFLSPANKYGQRSFSASSLYNIPATAPPLSGSLREQIRLEAFKKNLNQSKLSKTAFTRAPLKVQKDQRFDRHNDVRSEVRELQKENSIFRQENRQLKQQRTEDLLLVSRQNQLLVRLEKQINELRNFEIQKQPCECYLIQQHLLTIRGLQIKNKQLEEEKRQYRQEIRDLVVQQQQLKAELDRFQNNQRRRKIDDINRDQNIDRYERKRKIEESSRAQNNEQYERKRKAYNGKRQQMIDRWSQGLGLKKAKKREEQAKLQKIQKSKYDQPVQKNQQSLRKQGEGVRRYFQYLKNKQIDRIANIFDKQQEK